MAAVLESGRGLVYYVWGIGNSCLPSLYPHVTLDVLLTELLLLLDSYVLVVSLSASKGQGSLRPVLVR